MYRRSNATVKLFSFFFFFFPLFFTVPDKKRKTNTCLCAERAGGSLKFNSARTRFGASGSLHPRKNVSYACLPKFRTVPSNSCNLENRTRLLLLFNTFTFRKNRRALCRKPQGTMPSSGSINNSLERKLLWYLLCPKTGKGTS